MHCLRTHQPRNLIIANDFDKNGFRRELLVKIIQNPGQVFFNLRPEFPQRFTFFSRNVHETQPCLAVVIVLLLRIFRHFHLLLSQSG